MLSKPLVNDNKLIKSTIKCKLLFAAIFLLVGFTSHFDFINDQMRYQRVRAAYAEKGKYINEILLDNGIKQEDLNVLMVAYKAEKRLDIFAKNAGENVYRRMLSYDICQISGMLGPKRQRGDAQVPEGFYHITSFNPSSNYHLSMAINYPNLSDRRKSCASHLGDNICIHGSCATIGCLPMTDDFIKEIYLLGAQAKNNGQERIPVYIFPFIMDDSNMAKYSEIFSSNDLLLAFWNNLKVGYDKFEVDLKELKITVDSKGDYQFN